MPPIPEDVEDVEDTKFKAEKVRVMTHFRGFLSAQRPPLSVDEYEALIPHRQYVWNPLWTAQEEAQLRAEGKYACILDQTKNIWTINGGVRFLWRLFPMVYRCLPTDLFSWAYQIDVDTVNNSIIETHSHGFQHNIVWSDTFCHVLANFTMHGFWTYNKEWDFPIMAQLMQLMVICRTNDCRKWRLRNHAEDSFFSELAAEFQNQDAGVRTIKDVVGAVEARMKPLNLRPSHFRLLCQAIVRDFFNPNTGPLLRGNPAPYKVTINDLTALVVTMDSVGPSTERTGLSIGWSAETWKVIMDKSWPHNHRKEPLPNKDNVMLLLRAIMFGLMQRDRDEKIAKRQEAALALAMAQVQEQEQEQEQEQAQE